MAKEELPFYASLADNAFTRGLKRMESNADASGRKIGGLFTSLATGPLAAAGAAFAGAFTGLAIAEGVRGVFDLTKQLGELSDQTGVSVGHLAALGRQFQNAGLEADDAGAAINKMQRFLQQGGPGGDQKIFDTLRLLHLSFLQIKNLSPEQQFDVIGKAIAGLASPTARAAASMDIFGKSGGRLLRVFSDPNFANGAALTGRAAILERNAATFEEASTKLSHAGDLFKTFYTGTAERLAAPLVTALDRLEKVDLTSLGEAFGDDLVVGATGVVDMLAALKKADIVGVAKEFGSIFTDVATRIGKMFAQDVKDVQAIAGLLGKLGNIGTSVELEEVHPHKDSTGKLTYRNDAASGPAGGESSAGQTDRVAVDGRASLFKSAGMQFGQMNGQPIVNPAAKEFSGQGMQFGQGFNQVYNETAATGLQTGKLLTGGLATGGLSGPGSDTAEESRQSTKAIRDQIQYNNPLLTGGALNAAVQQEQNKQRDQARIDQFRQNYDQQHPAEAEARKAQQDKNKGATSGDIKTLGATLADKIEKLYAR